jgi:hypothetical protein
LEKVLRKMFFILVVIGSLLLQGCSNGLETEGEELATSEKEFPPAPEGFIKAGNQSYEMEQGNYQWRIDGTVTTTDHAGPIQIAESYKPIPLEPDETLNIIIEGEPKLTAFIWESDNRTEIANGTEMIMPDKQGRYIYEVVAKWKNGEVSYTFVVEVK